MMFFDLNCKSIRELVKFGLPIDVGTSYSRSVHSIEPIAISLMRLVHHDQLWFLETGVQDSVELYRSSLWSKEHRLTRS